MTFYSKIIKKPCSLSHLPVISAVVGGTAVGEEAGTAPVVHEDRTCIKMSASSGRMVFCIKGFDLVGYQSLKGGIDTRNNWLQLYTGQGGIPSL